MTATAIEGLKGLRQAAVERYRVAVIAAASGEEFDPGISDAISMLRVTLVDFEEDVLRLQSRRKSQESISELDSEIHRDAQDRADLAAARPQYDAKRSELIRQLNALDAELGSLDSRINSRSIARLRRDREQQHLRLCAGAHQGAAESDKADWRSGLLSIDPDPYGLRITFITPKIYGQ